MNKNFEFTVLYAQNTLWYESIDRRQIRLIAGGEPNVDFDAGDNCRFDVTLKKLKCFQDD